jgi:penicillin-binding protein 1A
MNTMLAHAVDIGTGKAAKLPGWPVAGKTGTTQNDRDAVFVGYTARMITGVWLGNDDDSPMKGVGGGSYPAQLWSQFMQKAHQNMTPANLPGDYALAGHPMPMVEEPKPDRKTLVDLIQQMFSRGN